MGLYFTENGSLTEEGTRLLSDIKNSLSDLIESDEVYRMDQTELRLLGSHLAHMTAEAISRRVSRKVQIDHKCQDMTDEEFETHIHNRYGNLWTIVTLEEEEYRRMPRSMLEKAVQDPNFIGDSLLKHLARLGIKVR